MVDDLATALYRATRAQNPCDAGALVAGAEITSAGETIGPGPVGSLLRGRAGTVAGPVVTDPVEAVAPVLDAERRAPTDARHAAFRQVARAADGGAMASGPAFAAGNPESDVVPAAAIAAPAAEPEPGGVPCTGSDGPDRPEAEFR